MDKLKWFRDYVEFQGQRGRVGDLIITKGTAASGASWSKEVRNAYLKAFGDLPEADSWTRLQHLLTAAFVVKALRPSAGSGTASGPQTVTMSEAELQRVRHEENPGRTFAISQYKRYFNKSVKMKGGVLHWTPPTPLTVDIDDEFREYLEGVIASSVSGVASLSQVPRRGGVFSAKPLSPETAKPHVQLCWEETRGSDALLVYVVAWTAPDAQSYLLEAMDLAPMLPQQDQLPKFVEIRLLVRELPDMTRERIEELARKSAVVANLVGIQFDFECRQYAPVGHLPDVLGTLIFTRATASGYCPLLGRPTGHSWRRVYFGPKRSDDSVGAYLSLPGSDMCGEVWATFFNDVYEKHWYATGSKVLVTTR